MQFRCAFVPMPNKKIDNEQLIARTKKIQIGKENLIINAKMVITAKKFPSRFYLIG